MAVPVIATSTFTFSNNSDDLVGNKPTGVVAGDLLVIIYLTTADVSGTAITLPSGFTSAGATRANISRHMCVAWKVATGSEPSTYTVGATGESGTEYLSTLEILRVTGAATSSPIDQISIATMVNGATQNITFNSVTTTVADDLIICTGYVASQNPSGSQWPNVTTTGLTYWSRYPAAAQQPGHEDYLQTTYGSQASPGAFGTKTITAATSNGVWYAFTVAIKPATSTNYDVGIGLGTSANLTETPAAQRQAAATLPASANLVDVSVVARSTLTNLPAGANISQAISAGLQAAFTAATQAAVNGLALRQTSPLLAFPVASAVAYAGAAGVTGLLGASAATGVTTGGAMGANPPASIAATAALVETARVAASAAVGLPVNGSLTTSLGGITLEVAMAATATASTSPVVGRQAGITLPAGAGVAMTATRAVAASVAAGATAALGMAAQRAAAASINVATNAGLLEWAAIDRAVAASLAATATAMTTGAVYAGGVVDLGASGALDTSSRGNLAAAAYIAAAALDTVATYAFTLPVVMGARGGLVLSATVSRSAAVTMAATDVIGTGMNVATDGAASLGVTAAAATTVRRTAATALDFVAVGELAASARRATSGASSLPVVAGIETRPNVAALDLNLYAVAALTTSARSALSVSAAFPFRAALYTLGEVSRRPRVGTARGRVCPLAHVVGSDTVAAVAAGRVCPAAAVSALDYAP